MKNNELDTLKSEFQDSIDPKTKIEIGYKLSRRYLINESFDLCRKYGYETIKLCEETKNIDYYVRITHIIGVTYAMGEDIPKALELFENALQISQINCYDYGIALSYLNIGSILFNKSKYSEALTNYIKSVNTFENITTNDPQLLDTIIINKITIYNNIGLIFIQVKKFSEGKEWLKKAIKIPTDKNRELTFYNLAYCYSELEEYDLAMGYLKRSVKLSENHNFHNLNMCFMSIATIHIKKNQYDKAIPLLIKAYDYFRKNNYHKDTLNAIRRIGNIYITQKNYDTAYSYLKKGFDIIELVPNDNYRSKFYKVYARYCYETALFQEAYNFLEKSSNLKDTVFDQDLLQNITFLTSQFDLDQKNKDLEISRLKNVELAKAQKTIELKIDTLMKINEEKDNILAMISHDLKNYLQITLSAYDMFIIKEKIFLSNKYMKMINDSCNKALSLIKDILYLNRIDIDQDELPLLKKDINNVINDLMNDLEQMAKRKSIKIVSDFHPEPLFCMINTDKFNRAIDNLVINAIKFSQKKDKITIKTSKNDQYAIINIIDTGIGMEKNIIPNLFKRYTIAGRKGTDGEESNGLGLYIVKKIMNQHNATIKVSSEVNKGSNFEIKLPLP